MTSAAIISITLFVSMLGSYVAGFWRGKVEGRRLEYIAWDNDITPRLRQMRDERDALHRSAIAKTHKLNRMLRNRS